MSATHPTVRHRHPGPHLAPDAGTAHRHALHTDTPEARGLVLTALDHELRTPLSSLIGYVELLLDGEAGLLTEEQALMLQRVDANASRLLVMVTRLLCDCSRALREGESVDLAAAVLEAVGGLDALDARLPRLGG